MTDLENARDAAYMKFSNEVTEHSLNQLPWTHLSAAWNAAVEWHTKYIGHTTGAEFDEGAAQDQAVHLEKEINRRLSEGKAQIEDPLVEMAEWQFNRCRAQIVLAGKEATKWKAFWVLKNDQLKLIDDQLATQVKIFREKDAHRDHLLEQLAAAKSEIERLESSGAGMKERAARLGMLDRELVATRTRADKAEAEVLRYDRMLFDRVNQVEDLEDQLIAAKAEAHKIASKAQDELVNVRKLLRKAKTQGNVSE